MSLGAFEREALEHQRERLLATRRRGGLSVYEARELDSVMAELERDDYNKAASSGRYEEANK